MQRCHLFLDLYISITETKLAACIRQSDAGPGSIISPKIPWNPHTIHTYLGVLWPTQQQPPLQTEVNIWILTCVPSFHNLVSYLTRCATLLLTVRLFGLHLRWFLTGATEKRYIRLSHCYPYEWQGEEKKDIPLIYTEPIARWYMPPALPYDFKSSVCYRKILSTFNSRVLFLSQTH